MSRIVWRQFGLALVATLAFFLLLRLQSHLGSSRWADAHGGIVSLLLIEWPGWIANALPIAAGVAMALLPIRPGAFPIAARMLGVVLLLLVIWDIAVTPWENRRYMEAYTPPPGEQAPLLRLDDTAGVLQRGVAHLRGIVHPEDLTRWPPPPTTDSTRFAPITDGSKIVRRDVAEVVVGLMDFVTPFLVMGFALGFGSWIRRIATFHRERDERLLRLVVGWGTAIGLPLFLGMLLMGMNFNISMRGQWMGWLVMPWLVATFPAFLGWRAVWRLDRLGAE